MAASEATPAVEYKALTASPLVNGEAKLSLGENGMVVASLFDIIEIPFAEINGLRFENYTVVVEADSGAYSFSRMGEWAQRFYDELYHAYNEAVLRSLFIKGKPQVAAKGEYHYTEGTVQSSGHAPCSVYENCVAVLPPDLGARRIPLCFLSGLEKGNFSLMLSLDTQESYTLAKLGYETEPLEKAIETQLYALQEKALFEARELDPSLTATQASQIAKLTLGSKAASLDALMKIAPSFKKALEEEINKTRAAEYYGALGELCGPAHIWVGFKKLAAEAEAEEVPEGDPAALLAGATGNPLAALGSLAQGAGPGAPGLEDSLESGSEPEKEKDQYSFFFIAPSPNGKFAAVEFSEADSATFVYRIDSSFEHFAKQINRALEAISFKREVIRLSDEELLEPANADYYMAAKRTASLQFVRSHFAGRVIHANPASWKKKLLELWG